MDRLVWKGDDTNELGTETSGTYSDSDSDSNSLSEFDDDDDDDDDDDEGDDDDKKLLIDKTAKSSSRSSTHHRKNNNETVGIRAEIESIRSTLGKYIYQYVTYIYIYI
jgi:hypothetical protein